MKTGIYKIVKRFFAFLNEETNKHKPSLSVFTDEELDTEIKKRQFSKINDGDYVLAFGVNGPEIMKVISKSEKVAYLKTKNGEASYHQAYHEIICKISKKEVMAQDNKDLCKTCKHYWQDFPLPLESVVSHCEILDEKHGLEVNMDDIVSYPCLKCPFDCYTKK